MNQIIKKRIKIINEKHRNLTEEELENHINNEFTEYVNLNEWKTEKFYVTKGPKFCISEGPKKSDEERKRKCKWCKKEIPFMSYNPYCDSCKKQRDENAEKCYKKRVYKY